MVINIPGIDIKIGLDDYCQGDVELYAEVLRSYVEDMLEAFEKIRVVSKESLSEYAVFIHGVKGISKAVGAEDARKTALRLQEMADNGNLAGVLAENTEFVKYAEKLVAGIQAWLKTLPG